MAVACWGDVVDDVGRRFGPGVPSVCPPPRHSLPSSFIAASRRSRISVREAPGRVRTLGVRQPRDRCKVCGSASQTTARSQVAPTSKARHSMLLGRPPRNGRWRPTRTIAAWSADEGRRSRLLRKRRVRSRSARPDCPRRRGERAVKPAVSVSGGHFVRLVEGMKKAA